MSVLAARKDVCFFPAVFALWALVLFGLHSGHRYFGTPLPSAGIERSGSNMSSLALLRNSLAELHRNLATEKNPKETPHILHNIGCAYYDLYKATGDRTLLDSALTFVHRSTVEAPGIARFHYNFGRMFTELGDQTRALQQYELALTHDPLHILALSNAGTCAYFAFNQRRTAAGYFARALAIDSLMPMCNVVLGLIGLDEHDYESARINFEKELVADATATVNNRYPLSLDNINYAALLSHRHLMTLYSTQFPDRAKAKTHLDAALMLEPDPQKREELITEFQTRWGG